MKRFKFPPLLAVVISLEMMLFPVAVHAQNLLQAVQTIGGAMTGPSGRAQANISMLAQQAQVQTADKQFNLQNLSRIPGLMQYLGANASKLNCMSLPAKPTVVKAEVCTMGFTGQPGMSLQPQVFEADAYAKAYKVLADRYDSFLVEGTNASMPSDGITMNGDSQGIGCMNNAMRMIDGFFQNRLNEINTSITAAEMAVADFKKKSEADLFQIEEQTADLEGEAAGSIYEKVKSRRPAYEFGNSFKDPACAAMFSSQVFNETGDGSGLKGIGKLLKQAYETPVNGAKYSAQSYSQSHNAVVQDLQSMASKIAQQSRLNFSKISAGDGNIGGFISGLKNSTSSSTGVNTLLSPDVFADVQANFTTKNSNMNETARTLATSMRSASSEFGSAIEAWKGNSDSAFNSAVNNLQNKLLNACLDRQLKGAGSLDSILSQINDRGITGKGAKNYDRAIISKRIKAILEDSGMGIDQKIKEIEKQIPGRITLEVSGNMITYVKDAEGKTASQTLQARDINTPAKYFGALANNCKVQFASSSATDEKSMKSNIDSLRKLREEYKELTESTSKGLASAIEEKLISCPSTSVGKSTGSCTPDVFNTKNGGSFCASAAMSCSKSMATCNQSAQNLVTAATNKRGAHMTNYNNQVNALKNKIVADIKQKISKYLNESLLLSQPPFNAGFNTPTDIAYEVPESQRYMNSFNQVKLKLEDPDKLLALLKGNMDKVKKAVADQQKQIMGRGGVLSDHIAQVKANYQRAQSDLERLSQECTQKVAELKRYENEQIRKMAEEQQKQQMEDQKNAEELCRRYSVAQQNPQAGCSNMDGDLLNSAARLTRMYGGQDQIKALELRCAGFNNNSSDKDSDTNVYESRLKQDALRKCRAIADNDPLKSKCDQLDELLKGVPVEDKEKPGKTVYRQADKDAIIVQAESIVGKTINDYTSGLTASDNKFSELGEQELPFCASMNNTGRGNDPSMWGAAFQGIAGSPGSASGR